jgi:hypothetical protein
MAPSDEPTLADLPLTSRLLHSPVIALDTHAALVANSLSLAGTLGKIEDAIHAVFGLADDGVFSLAQWQSPFKQQNDRGSCWAFAGAAALEAAYRRKFGTEIDVSEEYVFHMGKSFALNRDAQGNVAAPVENNTSLTGFQGSGDIVKKLTENAAPPESAAPYLPSQQTLLDILPVLGYTGQNALMSQEDFDAFEFCEQHVPLLARVNARYRATDWASLGGSPSVELLENTLLANHEVVCDVTHKTAPQGGHVLLLIGFDRNRKVFFAKNHWGENTFIEIAYANDPNWSIDSGWYIKDVVDPKFVQNEACWLGNWWLNISGQLTRILLRRSEDFVAPGTPTKLGSAYTSDGRHDVNGVFLNGGSTLRFFVAQDTNPLPPGTLSGTQVEVNLDFSDIYNVSGQLAGGLPVTMSRYTTRFAALFETDDHAFTWQARHGLDGAAYQQTFNELLAQGFRLTSVCGYSEGRDARYNAVWQQKDGPAWEARHGLTAEEYQTTFDKLVSDGFRLTDVSGYAINGEARFTGIWEKGDGPEWQARHGLSRAEYQQTFDELTGQGFVLKKVSGYRVDVDVRFAAIWEKEAGVTMVARHGLTSAQYQKTFDELVSAGHRLAWVAGYSDTGIARYAAVWRQEPSAPWQARHGLDAQAYQRTFDELTAQGLRPVHVSGYGDGFYPA